MEIPAKFKDIIEKVEAMSVLELSDLVKVLEEKFGVSAQAVAVAAAPTAGGDAVEEKRRKEETPLFGELIIFNIWLNRTSLDGMLASAITLSAPIYRLSNIPPKIFKNLFFFAKLFNALAEDNGSPSVYTIAVSPSIPGISPSKEDASKAFLTKVFLVTKYFAPTCLNNFLNSLTSFTFKP